jgi:hypothetical protein
MFGPHAPLLFYPSWAAQARGAQIHPLSWPEPRPRLPQPDFVRAQVEPVLDELPPRTLLIGKSLGTLAAPVAAERGLPAIWLTPVLTEERVVEALRAATAPFLLVGGGGDSMWKSDLAKELTPYLLEIDGADHGMMLPGPLAASAAVLGFVVTAVEQFLDGVVWPQKEPQT